MKYSRFLNKKNFLILGLFIILINSSVKSNIDTSLKDITSKLRCMTCQNQTIYSSDTDFSKNIKSIIKKKLENNETEEEILDFLIYRYGEYIVFKPKISAQNIFLWIFPFVILAISLVFFIIRIKKNS